MEDFEIKILLGAMNKMKTKSAMKKVSKFIADQTDPDYNGLFMGDINGKVKEFIFGKNVETGELVAIDKDCNEYDATEIQWW